MTFWTTLVKEKACLPNSVRKPHVKYFKYLYKVANLKKLSKFDKTLTAKADLKLGNCVKKFHNTRVYLHAKSIIFYLTTFFALHYFSILNITVYCFIPELKIIMLKC